MSIDLPHFIALAYNSMLVIMIISSTQQTQGLTVKHAFFLLLISIDPDVWVTGTLRIRYLIVR